LVALENADRTLARSGRPRFGAIRGAIEKDIERLRSVPDVDVSEQVLKLDAIIEKVDSLPLVSDSRSPDCPEEVKQNTLYRYEFSVSPSDWGSATVTAWNSLVDDIRRELQTLVRVQKIVNPDALMLSPSQTVYVRENLKFRLLSSRLSLLSRSAYSLKEDIETIIVMLDRYFDASSEQVQTVKATLKEIGASDISVDIPELTESLAAIQGYRQEN
jgi:uroporphyrin-3 C-methyltransferase/uroporphyrinogen III methyltransferase/synthase